MKKYEYKTEHINPNRWFVFYIIGILGILIAVLFRRNLAAEFFLLRDFDFIKNNVIASPSTIIEWFELFKTNMFVGLIITDFFDIINSLMVTSLLCGVYYMYKKPKSIFIIIAVPLSFLSLIFFLCSNISFSLLSLSERYFAAASIAEQQRIIQMGEEILNNTKQFFNFQGISYSLALFFLFSAGLLASIAMRFDSTFTKRMSIIGLIAHITGLIYFFVLPFSFDFTAIPLTLSAPFIIIWYFMIALLLLRFGKTVRRNKNL